jgi:hypothetical protein
MTGVRARLPKMAGVKFPNPSETIDCLEDGRGLGIATWIVSSGLLERLLVVELLDTETGLGKGLGGVGSSVVQIGSE